MYLQILHEIQSYDDHDPESTISLNLIPCANPAPSPTPDSDTTAADPPLSSTDRLFAALTDCANLHPDPMSDSEAGGGGPAITFEGDQTCFSSTTNGHSALPPPMPGSGGWITAENIGDFYDDDGNLRDFPDLLLSAAAGGATLGNGAGSVRARDEDEDGDVGDEEDVRANGDETKWRRTE